MNCLDGSESSSLYIDLKNGNGAVGQGKPKESEVQFGEKGVLQNNHADT